MSHLFWVVTHPLSYRLTEPIMNEAFKVLGFEGNYDSKDVDESGLEEVIQKVRQGELKGISVFKWVVIDCKIETFCFV